MDDELLILHEGRPGRPEGRLEKSLRAALGGRAVRMVREGEALENRRVLFAFSLPENGVSAGLWGFLGWLRDHRGCLCGSVGGVVIDGDVTINGSLTTQGGTVNLN